eukprot:TRINITY_DN28206_c0_g1_i1.p1 TRINITY_DN28206_c0_g1~~TRINITY_DN28206_c0_g1_i1.p1  ORF type:complete len:307 (+),score=48.57 TRINITY_DN28206_c0_g1_i1:154-1074(+)
MLRSLVGSEMCIRDSVETADFAGMELSRSAVFGRYGGGDELAISPPWCLIELAQQSVGSAVRDEVYRLLETGYLGYAALSEMYGVEPAQVPGVEELEWSVKLSVGGVPEGENRFNVLLSGWLYPQGTAGCAPADGSMPSKFPLVGMIRGHGWECGRSEDAATLGDGVLKPAHHGAQRTRVLVLTDGGRCARLVLSHCADGRVLGARPSGRSRRDAVLGRSRRSESGDHDCGDRTIWARVSRPGGEWAGSSGGKLQPGIGRIDSGGGRDPGAVRPVCTGAALYGNQRFLKLKLGWTPRESRVLSGAR